MRTLPLRTLPLLLVALTFGALLLPQFAVAQSGLVSTLKAERLGLERGWFSQAQIDRQRHHVVNAVLEGDLLLVLSDSGVLHAMNAETGKTAWIAQFGNPNYPSLGPAANKDSVAMINGSTLYVLDRSNGLQKMMKKLSGGAGGGPALTDDYVIVPMFSGRVEAYSLGEPLDFPWYYSSTGRVFDSPVATPDSVVWPTDRGFLYVANRGDEAGIRYRFESAGRIMGHPASVDGTLYFTSTNGYLYAINEQNGQQIWRYSVGSPISKPPLVVDGMAYVATDEPSLHAVDIQTGTLRWLTPGVSRVAGVGKTNVYGMNRFGQLLVVDSRSGVPLGQLETCLSTMTVSNSTTDRIYLVNSTGLVQCMHEVGSDEPYLHDNSPKPEADADEAADASADEEPMDEAADEPADDANPFGAANSNPFGDTSNPFGDTDDDNADDPENPFPF
ncbi:outer membrane protein assembly factor BamB family protein [Aeoliella mucimassa]|uniref:Serine/threonine-protein kinase AfsK n=1 Tax=Aeoliella mucimassa TaxID=2527972 RepID=A0A518AGM3_9BACT|nr:PQQ-binding-like beta-propeller repeat protein [Aeoliella mucimassa]QDU53878.1 Serine/threonine-protein kinase AfsK [Aeoliella mucimassa]